MKIKDLAYDLRPRERLQMQGVKALSNAEILAILLRIGNKKENVIQVAQRLLQNHNLKTLASLDMTSMQKELGIGKVKAGQIIAAFELGRRVASLPKQERIIITSAKDVANIFQPEMSMLKQEHFKGIYLNVRKQVLKIQTLFVGTVDATLIHPREIFEPALRESAAGVIIVHNHPSGNPNPSRADLEVTKQLKRAGEMLEIKLLDHVIIGEREFYSFKEKNLL